MPYQVGNVLAVSRIVADLGSKVAFEAGWESRGSSTFTPRGHVLHHDVSPTGRDIPHVIRDGHSSLTGPLSNWYVHRTGLLRVIAAGRANHAGVGGWRGLSGNASVFGTEVANNGVGERYTRAQLDTIDRLHVALNTVVGLDWCCSHAEWTPRKSDIGWRLGQPWDMQAYRAGIKAVLKTIPEEGFMAALTAEEQRELLDRIRRLQDGAPQFGIPPFHDTQLQIAGIKDGPIKYAHETVHREVRRNLRWVGRKLGGVVRMRPEGDQHIGELMDPPDAETK